MKTNFIQLKELSVVVSAKKKPIKANGMAKIVCAKRTNERYFFIV
jgi:hypothetical protein